MILLNLTPIVLILYNRELYTSKHCEGAYRNRKEVRSRDSELADACRSDS
jgi:hypothetical protein